MSTKEKVKRDVIFSQKKNYLSIFKSITKLEGSEC